MERVEARLPHPVRVAAEFQQRLHHGARVPELDLAPVAARHQRMRLARIVLHIARRHHVRLLIHQHAPAVAVAVRQREVRQLQLCHLRDVARRGVTHFMERVSTMLMDVPAASATMPGLCGSQHPAVIGADGSSETGTAPVTFGAPACSARTHMQRKTWREGARVTRLRRTSTPQMRKPASSTVAKPRPPCMGQSTLRGASAREHATRRRRAMPRGRARTAAWSCRRGRTPPRAPSPGTRGCGRARVRRALQARRGSAARERARRTPPWARCWWGSATATRGGPCLRARAQRRRRGAAGPARKRREQRGSARALRVAVAGG